MRPRAGHGPLRSAGESRPLTRQSPGAAGLRHAKAVVPRSAHLGKPQRIHALLPQSLGLLLYILDVSLMCQASDYNMRKRKYVLLSMLLSRGIV